MGYDLLKIGISAILIFIISETAKRSSLVGAIFASIPLTSVLAMIWLYIDSKNVEAISQLSIGIFWLVIPSLILFVSLPVLLKLKFGFYPALGLSSLLTVLGYVGMSAALIYFRANS